MHRLIGLFALVTAVGCADSGDEGFVISHNLASGEDDCILTIGGLSRSRGQIYLDSPNPYFLTPQFESRVTALDTQVNQRTIALRGARVDLSVAAVTVKTGTTFDVFTPERIDSLNAGFTSQLVKFTSLFSAPLPPGGQATASFAVVTEPFLAELKSKVGGSAESEIQAELVARITPFGFMGGGDDEIQGVPFEYPITACNDCIVNVIGACPVPMELAPRPGNACNMFQDGVVDCCDSGAGIICPAPIETM